LGGAGRALAMAAATHSGKRPLERDSVVYGTSDAGCVSSRVGAPSCKGSQKMESKVGNRTSGVARVLLTGAGGFIGHHLCKFLVKQGYWVRGADTKYPEYERTPAHEFEILDLRRWANCLQAVRGVEQVYNLAANMGGIGFIQGNKAIIMHDNVLINTHMLEAARLNGVEKFLYASSACVYPMYKQQVPDVSPLKEEDAYPAEPEDGYGWEKLFTERQCRHYYEDYGLKTYVARFHNIFGPLGTYDGGREKSPAAICRKVALARDGDEIEVWGDGQQTRSYCYVSDCVEGIYRLVRSDFHDPINLGQDRLISVSELIRIVAKIAGKTIGARYDLAKPQGVRGRNADISLMRKVLDWEPRVTLDEGLHATYHWIEQQLRKEGRL